MKKILVLPVLGLLLITACNTKENEALRRENEQLRKELDEAKAQQNLNEPGKPNRLEPLPIEDLRTYIKSIQSAGSIKIPVSLEFEENNLKFMLDNVDAEGHEAEGVLAYPILEGGILKLALIPYYKDGGEIKHFSADQLGAYNYSHMCPPAASGAVNANLLFGADTKTYDFHK